MTTITECDGCGTRLDRARGDIRIEGRITGPPDTAFHWCQDCAAAATTAVHAAAARPGTDEDWIRDAMTEARDRPGHTITR